MKPIISGSGIRGVFGSSLTTSDAMAFAAAFGTLCGGGAVVVGRDTRRSGPAVLAAACAGLMSAGCDPVDIGVVPTPTVQLEAMRNGMAGGMAITSSHNPGQWNALKLIGPDGVFLRAGARKRFLELLESGVPHAGHRTVGTPRTLDGSIERHVEGVLALPYVRAEGRRLKVVLDVTGGTAASFAPPLMERLDVEYSMINPSMTPEGDFPREPEPVPDSLGELSRRVVEEGADAGFAFDPDGDRLALVDENGRVIGEDFTVTLALDFRLAAEPGPAVVNLSTSMTAEDAARKHGCALHRSPVGEVNVVEEMERRGAVIGGEGNGGVIDGSFHAGRDSGVAMACVVSFLRMDPEMTLGSWADGFPVRRMFKTKVGFREGFEHLEGSLVGLFGPPDDCRDGLWYRRGDGWMHLRPSGTEPVVRFIAENSDSDYIERDLRSFRRAVENLCVE